MKKITVTILFIFSFLIYSQEIDDNFLDSLPEEQRREIQDKIDSRNESEKPVYRRASTKLDKNRYQDGEYIYFDEDEEEDDDDDVFGSIFFDTMQSSFMPINEPNLDSSYILDFGDVIEIQLIGQKDSNETYSINRDGSINISDIGKIILSGLSMSDASSLLKAKFKDAYIGTDAYITLKNIRDISVLIAGNAFNPGVYTINGNSSMLHALSMAGGVDEIGSYRSIDLVRDGKIIDNLDIYDAMIFGNMSFSRGLRSGDSIVVNPRQNIVSIETGVKRPGKYELTEGESIEHLIRYASGYNINAKKTEMSLKRLNNGIATAFDIIESNISNFKLLDGDIVYISEFKVNNVSILGAIKNPGTYRVAQGTTLSQLIQNAGGYDKMAYPFGGYLENAEALEINDSAKDKLYDKFIENLIRNSNSSDFDLTNYTIILDQLKNAKVTGRVIAEFDLDIINNNPAVDTVLSDGDKILIPNVTQQVYIQGEISNPGAIRYSPGKDISYYIDNSGGALENADLDNLFIIHPNGETQNLRTFSSFSFLNSQNNNQLVYPGSIIFVPQSANFTNGAQIASVWAPIISSLALSLTSLSVLNNN